MVGFEFEGSRYACSADETLLESLLRHGAELPHSCRRGSCHACVLKVESGAVERSREIDPALAAGGYTLACVSRPAGTGLRLRRPQPDELGFEAELLQRRELAPGIFALDLAPLRGMDFRAGQFVQIVDPGGARRPYSLASRAGDDWFFTLHVKRIAGGRVSGWLCERLQPGQRLTLQGPFGDCCYQPSMQGRPLLLLATGTGTGALLAVAREALAEGHDGGILLCHGARSARDLYLRDALEQLAQSEPRFRHLPCATDEAGEGVVQRRVADIAFAGAGPSRDAEIFLCGLPRMVEEARYRARLAGFAAARIHADPFEFATPPAPRDADKLAGVGADPELWAALEQGPGLTRILQAFYARVYADPRLAPFFQQVPQERAVQKQYEFLAALFSGSREYFGLNPFNAHHWMVISDALFDHREALFEQVLHEQRLPAHLVDRWLALHELFRSELVKPAARGQVVGGVELPLRSHSVECLQIDAVCDGCGAEIPAGQPSRYQYRIGALHCADCAGLAPASVAAPALG